MASTGHDALHIAATVGVVNRQWRTGREEESGECFEFQQMDFSGTVVLSEPAVAEIRLWLSCV